MKGFLSFILIYPLISLSQNPRPFKIAGTYSLDSNRAIRIYEALYDSAYNDFYLDKNEITVTNKKFEIKGTVKYTTPFEFSYFIKEKGQGVVSDILFIEGGDVKVNLKDFTKDNNIILKSSSRSNLEYQQIRLLYRRLENRSSGLDGINIKDLGTKDKILQSYIKSHPNSYVAMWILILDYAHFGYTELINNTAALFSDEIKGSKAFQTLQKRLGIDRSVKIADGFPFDRFTFGESLKHKVQLSHYTLIDFWATYCKPCIAQFPGLTELYASLHSKGFTAYTVSIDKKDNILKMNEIIKSSGIIWENILDVDGKESAKLNISGVPVNFLLDSEGNIIAKNISTEELRIFLSEKLQ